MLTLKDILKTANFIGGKLISIGDIISAKGWPWRVITDVPKKIIEEAKTENGINGNK